MLGFGDSASVPSGSGGNLRRGDSIEEVPETGIKPGETDKTVSFVMPPGFVHAEKKAGKKYGTGFGSSDSRLKLAGTMP